MSDDVQQSSNKYIQDNLEEIKGYTRFWISLILLILVNTDSFRSSQNNDLKL